MEIKIEHIAMLSRLRLSEEERGVFSKQISSIIEYISKLNEIDTSDVEPTSHVLQIKNVFRDDERKSSLSKDKALQNAPDRADGFFRVPKIIG